MDRVKCKNCDNMVLPVTAQYNDGLCGQCLMRLKASSSPPARPQFSGKYDDASWHYGGGFPSELSPEAGATHIGMFVVACIQNGLVGELHGEEFPEGLLSLQNRKITPGAWLMEACDQKFTDEELNDEGNEFALFYYYSSSAQYPVDYENAVCQGLASVYHVPDTWEIFERIEPIVRRRLHEWRVSKKSFASG